MILDDRFTRGLLAGVLGGIPALVWGLLSKYVLRFTDMLFLEFAAILVYGKPAVTLADRVFAQVVVFAFYGICGILFVFLVPYITSKNLVLKGFIWGAFIWFFSYMVTFLFKVPGLLNMNLSTSVSQLIGGVVWGVFLAIVLQYFDKRVKS